MEGALTMVDLHALVYVSTATHQLSLPEIRHLLERARARNIQEGITGVLLYSHGNFMQYLEGTSSGMSKVYDIIKADPLHKGIIELLREPIPSREFSGWSMAFRSISAFGTSDPPQLDAVFLARFDPAGLPPSAADTLLWKFWNKGACFPSGRAIRRSNAADLQTEGESSSVERNLKQTTS
jgi:hypothetical protein